MKKLFLSVLLMILFYGASAQTDTTSWFDFWVGDWALTWKDGKGNVVHGENKISKIHNGKVILEEFSAPSLAYTGSSYSVFNPQRKEWKQTWVDSQGGYITLTGRKEGDTRIFETTEPMIRGNDQLLFRMIFHSITPESFVWEWQSTSDNITWATAWKIEYKRK